MLRCTQPSAPLQDTQLDKVREEVDAELSAAGSMMGYWGQFVTGLCHSPQLLGSSFALRSSALLALGKLMALDGRYCEANCSVFFTLLTIHRRWAHMSHVCRSGLLRCMHASWNTMLVRARARMRAWRAARTI